MSALSALLPLLTGAALLTAGILKLPDARGVVEFVQRLGLPYSLQRIWVGHATSGFEALLGLLLLFSTGLAFAVASLASCLMFAFYAVLLARIVLRRQDIPCNCFGPLSGSKVTTGGVVRNACLFALGIPALLGATDMRGVLFAASSLSPDQFLFFTLGALILLLGGLCWFAWRSSRAGWRANNASADTRAETGIVNAKADSKTETGQLYLLDMQTGRLTTLSGIASERPVVAILAKPGCAFCVHVLEVLPELAGELSPGIAVAIVTPTDPESALRYFSDVAGVQVYLDVNEQFKARFSMAGSPSAVLLRSGGEQAANIAVGGDSVIQLLRKSRAILDTPHDSALDSVTQVGQL